jgi:hypothetical protein
MEVASPLADVGKFKSWPKSTAARC